MLGVMPKYCGSHQDWSVHFEQGQALVAQQMASLQNALRVRGVLLQ